MKLRIPLDLWWNDMEKIASEWNGKSSGNMENRYNLALQAQGLIERLQKVLDELNY